MTEVKALNETGIEKFRQFLTDLKAEPTLGPPISLLSDPNHTEGISGTAVIEQRGFGSKYEFGSYLNGQIDGRLPVQLARNSAGLWAWMSLYYFDELCPVDGNGRRRVLASEKYVASNRDIRRGLDKHLLYFPWKLVSIHGAEASWLLYTSLGQDTKFVRELADSYRRNVSPAFLGLARAVYFDERRRVFRIGATTGGSKARGTLRRLNKVTDQLDMTYDIFGLEASELMRLLPSEFGKWLVGRA